MTKIFHNILEISDTPQSEFVQTMTADAPEAEKLAKQAKMVQVHTTAVQQKLYLDNLLTAYAVDRANGFDTPFTHKMQEILASHRAPPAPNIPCECHDCESAVSPLAYLADLIDYTLKKVKKRWQAPYL